MTNQPPQPPPPSMPYPPHYPMQPAKKKPNILLIILAGIGVVVVLCCGGVAVIGAMSGDPDKTTAETAADASKQNDSTDAPATGDPSVLKQTSKPAPPPKPAGPGIGDKARDGQFEFVVTKVSCGKTRVGPEQFGAKAQGVFCLINVTVANIGKEPRSFTGGNQKAFTASGSEYTNSTEAEMYANEDAATFLNEINPGNRVKGTLVFDVPKGTKLTKIELHDSMFSGGVTVRLS